MTRVNIPRATNPCRLRKLLLALPLVWLGLSLGAPEARAARPMLTDDARVVDEKSCQVESWVRRNQHSTERWALPACNFGYATEFTLGGSHLSGPTSSGNAELIAQAKHVFTPLTEGGWGRGFALGYAAHPGTFVPRRYLGDAYAYLLNSYASRDGRFVVHTNLGWSHDKAASAERLSWGIGTEVQQTARLYWVAEVFGRDQGRAWYQAGARLWLIPDRVQVDATLGNRFGSAGEDRWISVGLRLLSPAFLP
jgi:hypothetical protein